MCGIAGWIAGPQSPLCLDTLASMLQAIAHRGPDGFRRAKTAVTNLYIEDRSERYVRWFGALNRAERERLSVLRVRCANSCAITCRARRR